MTPKTLTPFFAALLISAVPAHAQAPQTGQSPPAPASPASDSSASEGSASVTPLPTKVLGQVPPGSKYAVAGEVTYILQNLGAFHSSYSGANSLRSRNETELSHTYTLYAGVRPTPRLEIYVNPEIALGNGISAGDGLAGYTDGDLIGQPTLLSKPYLARFFVRWRIPLKSGAASKQKQNIKPGNNLIGGNVPASRFVVDAGKLAISDHIDVNTYANNARSQFLNNAFINNLAYDYAGDPRGYTNGLVLNLIKPNYALRFGTVAMPTTAGNVVLAYNLASQHSEQAELELHPRFLDGHGAQTAIVRLLAYRNEAMMGRYRDALAAASPGTAPDVTAVRRRGAAKYGFGINFEQGLSDGGVTGIFGRLGWNDGSTETFSYAEADRFVSLGGQLSGAHWKRPKDVLGVALAQSDLSSAHKAYLAAGGLGLSLGDG